MAISLSVLESPMDTDHLSKAVLIRINLQQILWMSNHQILWMPNVTLLAMRKLQGGLNPCIFLVKTLLNTYISSLPFATPKVVKP